MHASCGVIMGYYFGNYFFRNKPRFSKAYLCRSLSWSLQLCCELFVSVGLIIIVFMILICDQLHRKVRRVQQLRPLKRRLNVLRFLAFACLGLTHSIDGLPRL